MIHFIIFVAISIILLVSGLVGSWIFIWKQAIDASQKIQLFISLLTPFALLIGGLFAYLKYDDYRRESNYQKVMVRYLDKNIDILNAKMSDYTMRVSSMLSLYCDEKCNIKDKNEREKMYICFVNDARDLTSTFFKLYTFDTSVQLAYINVFVLSKSILRLTLDEPINIKLLKNKTQFVESFFRFVSYNLQDIGELISRDSKIYDAPNIECIKKDKEFEVIINRFKEFNKLFDNGNALNNQASELKLLSFIAEYLNKKGDLCIIEQTKELH